MIGEVELPTFCCVDGWQSTQKGKPAFISQFRESNMICFLLKQIHACSFLQVRN